MFVLIRSILGIIIFLISVLIIKKSKLKHKWYWYIGAYAFATTLVVISLSMPIEKQFMSFSSPEESFQYLSGNSGKIEIRVDGKESTFIRGTDSEGSVRNLIIPKMNDKWELGNYSDIEDIILSWTQDKFAISICQYKDSNEYYISIYGMGGSLIEISDSKNSEFYKVSYEYGGRKKYTSNDYYAYIPSLDEGYWIEINGQKTSFSELKENNTLK